MNKLETLKALAKKIKMDVTEGNAKETYEIWDGEDWAGMGSFESVKSDLETRISMASDEKNEVLEHHSKMDALLKGAIEVAVMDKSGSVIYSCKAQGRSIQFAGKVVDGQAYNVSEMKVSRAKKNLEIAKLRDRLTPNLINNEIYYSHG